MSAQGSRAVHARTVALAVAIPLVLLLLPARFTAPLRTVFVDGAGVVTGAAFRGAGDSAAAGGTLTDMFLTQQKSRVRSARLQRLENELEAAQARIEQQRRQLESVSGLRISPDRYRFVNAGVTSYDASALRAGITVGAGHVDGVRGGQAVTALGALVGVVERVGRWHSTVRLLTDPKSAIAARVKRTRRLCVLEGTGTVEVGEEKLEVTAGTLVESPKDIVHCWYNESDAPMKFMVVKAPRPGKKTVFVGNGG